MTPHGNDEGSTAEGSAVQQGSKAEPAIDPFLVYFKVK